MKETLDEQSRQDLVAYRINRAEETIREAEVMLREMFFNAAINRPTEWTVRKKTNKQN